MNNRSEMHLNDVIDVIEEVLASGGEFRLFPKGVSMRPLIVQGRDSVVLKRNDKEAAKKHDIAFYRRENGAFVLHRVMKVHKDGTFDMCGDNQFEIERGIGREQIIGYVSVIYRKDRAISVSSPMYKLYVFLWTKMPLRKIAVAIRGIFKK
jgi:hypothetical protein